MKYRPIGLLMLAVMIAGLVFAATTPSHQKWAKDHPPKVLKKA